MSYSEEVKQLAYKMDEECWVSYSGQPAGYKRAMDKRRVFSLDIASHILRERAKMRVVHAPEKENTELSDREKLLKHYNEVIIPMCKGTMVKPWECVRLDGDSSFIGNPGFRAEPRGRYEFAITVHLNRPVWVGSVLYNTNTADKITIRGINEEGRLLAYFMSCKILLTSDWREWAVWDEPVKQGAPTRVYVGRPACNGSVSVPEELRVAGPTVVLTFGNSKDAVEFYEVFGKVSDEKEIRLSGRYWK